MSNAEKIYNLFKNYCKKNNTIDLYYDPYDKNDIYYALYDAKTYKTPCGAEYTKNIKYNYDDFLENFYNCYSGLEIDAVNNYIDDFLNTLSLKLKNYCLNNDDILEDLQDIIYDNVNIVYPLNDLLNEYIKINIFYKKDYDDFLVFLLHSQDLLLRDHYYLKKILKNEDLNINDKTQLNHDYENNKFLKSLIDEIKNLYINSYYQLCFIAKIKIKDYFDLMKKNKRFLISKDVYCGLVDRLNGGGSILNIDLQKDIKLSTDQIILYVERIDDYTVDNIYGLCSSCFKECITVL